jgi:hypothetical protein
MEADVDKIPEAFLATFGAWEDDREAEEIVYEIYTSRTVSQVKKEETNSCRDCLVQMASAAKPTDGP